MDDKKENIIYTKADIDNYLQGKMSKEAMHSFERVALQDAFLADAIEGYHFVDAATANNDLAAIEALILADKQETKVVPIVNKNKSWLRVAAIAILLAGVGFVSFLLMKKDDEKLVVSYDKINTLTEKGDIVKTDTNHRAVEIEPTPPQQEIVANKSSKKSIVTKDETVAATSTIQSQQASSAGTTSANQNIASNKSAGPSANNATNYIAFNDDKKETVTTEWEKRKDESVKKFKTNSNTTGSVSAENSIVVLPTIRLQRDSSFDKIPVTAYASKKAAAKPLAFHLTKEDSSMVPANGWAAFNDYLQHNNTTNITYDTTFSPVTIINNKTGEEIVGLEFDIDKFGMPDKIKITKSVDPETDAKAIDLLKKGPKWITTDKKQKGKIAIKF